LSEAAAHIPLWTAAEAVAATGGKAIGEWSVSGVSIDSRSLVAGDLFVALTDQRDGHDFVEAAFTAGARACLVARDMGRPGLVVGDVLVALEQLGLAARARSGAICCAITGSVGKTSVKEMLARMFRAAGPAHWSDKSFNNHWGVPLTLARMPASTRRAIFEIGMSTPGEIAPRSNMVRPQVAMITRIAPAHLQGMGTLEAIADEKADIFSGLQPDGVAILPADDRFFERMAAHARRLQPGARLKSFGATRGVANASPTAFTTDGESSILEAEIEGEKVRLRIHAVGEHWALNCTLALLAAVETGLSAREAAAALDGYAPPSGRGVAETLHLPGGGAATLVDDSYNANPASMRAAIDGLSRRAGRRIVLLGEMFELGPDAARLHAELAPVLKQAGVALAVLSGAGMAPLHEALADLRDIEAHCVADAATAAEAVNKHLRGGDVLLIKGSNASGMHKVAAALREASRAAAMANPGPGQAGGTG
jgi:UDP-N-acetylmuramoyl-tripeptide--D-alanyl-D-alanine ligase